MNYIFITCIILKLIQIQTPAIYGGVVPDCTCLLYAGSAVIYPLPRQANTKYPTSMCFTIAVTNTAGSRLRANTGAPPESLAQADVITQPSVLLLCNHQEHSHIADRSLDRATEIVACTVVMSG